MEEGAKKEASISRAEILIDVETKDGQRNGLWEGLIKDCLRGGCGAWNSETKMDKCTE